MVLLCSYKLTTSSVWFVFDLSHLKLFEQLLTGLLAGDFGLVELSVPFDHLAVTANVLP